MVRLRRITDNIQGGVIKVTFVPGTLQKADCFTKILAESKITELSLTDGEGIMTKKTTGCTATIRNTCKLETVIKEPKQDSEKWIEP